jgi:glyoxylase-like metal-dependent hydrolase (beta-lactamase superfamily II)
MDVVELLPRLHLLRFPVGQAYLWRDGDDRGELTLIDAGPAGSGAPIAEAVTALGRDPRDVRRIVLTHFHEDHAGGAGEFAALSGAEVLVHRLDAPFVRGGVPGPPPVFEDWERPLHELQRPSPRSRTTPGVSPVTNVPGQHT